MKKFIGELVHVALLTQTVYIFFLLSFVKVNSLGDRFGENR